MTLEDGLLIAVPTIITAIGTNSTELDFSPKPTSIVQSLIKRQPTSIHT